MVQNLSKFAFYLGNWISIVPQNIHHMKVNSFAFLGWQISLQWTVRWPVKEQETTDPTGQVFVNMSAVLLLFEREPCVFVFCFHKLCESLSISLSLSVFEWPVLFLVSIVATLEVAWCLFNPYSSQMFYNQHVSIILYS